MSKCNPYKVDLKSLLFSVALKLGLKWNCVRKVTIVIVRPESVGIRSIFWTRTQRSNDL